MNREHGLDGSAGGSVEAIYRAEHGKLLSAARRSLPPVEAEDAVQETFMALLARQITAHEGGKPADVRAWMRGTLRHKIADALRYKLFHSAERLGKLLDDLREVPSAEGELADREEVGLQVARLREALERHAGEPGFDILEAHYLEGKKLVDIAAEKGITPAQAGERQQRALNKLREEWSRAVNQTAERRAKRRRKKT